MATTDSTTIANPSGSSVVATVTPVMETSSLDALDAGHTNSLKLLGMARVNGGSGVVRRVTVIDKDDVGTGLLLHFFTAETTQTADAAFAPSDAEAATYLFTISTGATWQDFNTSKVITVTGEYAYRCAAADSALYVTVQVPSATTPTYTASGIVVAVQADRA